MKTENRNRIENNERDKTETENKVIKTKKAMKTKNNVQKTVLRAAAVVVSFVLISFTVAAQDFWKTVLTNSSFNQIALAMVETSKKSDVPATASKTNNVSYIYEKDYDDKLNVEDWMTNNEYFTLASFLPVEKDNDLQLEDWMLDENLFAVTAETESPLALESWMTSSSVWNY